jgi:hypothetical protein
VVKSKTSLEEKVSKLEKEIQEKADQLTQEHFVKEKIERNLKNFQ